VYGLASRSEADSFTLTMPHALRGEDRSQGNVVRQSYASIRYAGVEEAAAQDWKT
jgi:hypothetical protein